MKIDKNPIWSHHIWLLTFVMTLKFDGHKVLLVVFKLQAFTVNRTQLSFTFLNDRRLNCTKIKWTPFKCTLMYQKYVNFFSRWRLKFLFTSLIKVLTKYFVLNSLDAITLPHCFIRLGYRDRRYVCERLLEAPSNYCF